MGNKQRKKSITKNEIEALTELNVCFTVNKKYFQQFLVCLYSLIHSKGFCGKLHVFLVSPDDLSLDIQNVKKIFQSNISFDFLFPEYDFSGQNLMRNDTSMTAYYKVLLPLLLYKKVGKFLYLDADIIVENYGTIKNIYCSCNSFLSVVKDSFCAMHNASYFLKNNISPDGYFNSGVMIFNLNVFSPESYRNEVISILSSKRLFRFHDQDILNIVARDLYKENISYLPECINFLTIYKTPLSMFIIKKANNYAILHYCNLKPWNENYIGYFLNEYKKIYSEAKHFYEGLYTIDFYRSEKCIPIIKAVLSKIKKC